MGDVGAAPRRDEPPMQDARRDPGAGSCRNDDQGRENTSPVDETLSRSKQEVAGSGWRIQYPCGSGLLAAINRSGGGRALVRVPNWSGSDLRGRRPLPQACTINKAAGSSRVKMGPTKQLYSSLWCRRELARDRIAKRFAWIKRLCGDGREQARSYSDRATVNLKLRNLVGLVNILSIPLLQRGE